MGKLQKPIVLVLMFLHVLSPLMVVSAGHDYGEALTKSILFFEAQRSGVLPNNQRVKWRGDSGLNDGKSSGVNLVGGYHDAGDNVKFGLPMAFTVTMMSWSIIEYGSQMSKSGELGHAMEAVKWGTDYFIKAHPEPNVFYGEVGDGNTDHYCWQRPEDMTTDRQAYRIDASRPGSDLAGETAAAMAAASIVFRHSNPSYSKLLITHAKQLFDFADKYRGKYDSSISVARKYYQSFSGYGDELLWAAGWMYQATNEDTYLNYFASNADNLGGTGWAMTEFGWDVKYPGAQVLGAKFLLQGKAKGNSEVFEQLQEKADYFMCACLGKGSRNVQKTPGGLLFHQRWNNLQFVTSAAFLMTVYADYLTTAGKTVQCPRGTATPDELHAMAKSQVDYILGNNPRATSYMVGYGHNFPQQTHHRASSIVSYKVDKSFVTCRGGYATWYSRKGSDPNVLTGAIVGGPDAYDNFADERDNYEQTEPATYNNAPLLGVLARLNGGNGGYSQGAVAVISPKPVVTKPTPTPAPKPKPTPVQKPKPTPAPKPKYTPVQKPKPTPVKASSSKISVTQKATTTWNAKGKTYHRYSATVTNNSGKTLKELKLYIDNLYGPVWGLTKSGNAYTFPSWLTSLPAGKSMEFVYIHANTPAAVSVSSYALA
ncbi:endoglucanase 6-like [Papaver somniferum]|uniref:endoglucanase 6-like n=1 Tax=Papaver somniferum TaxID=3469 RepID=UPI000E703A9D|nr:endoglucanase 6-like [Papaver somniferum]